MRGGCAPAAPLDDGWANSTSHHSGAAGAIGPPATHQRVPRHRKWTTGSTGSRHECTPSRAGAISTAVWAAALGEVAPTDGGDREAPIWRWIRSGTHATGGQGDEAGLRTAAAYRVLPLEVLHHASAGCQRRRTTSAQASRRLRRRPVVGPAPSASQPHRACSCCGDAVKRPAPLSGHGRVALPSVLGAQLLMTRLTFS
jgi:hypothetical protein